METENHDMENGTLEEELPVKKSPIPWIVGGAVLVVLLAGAAFVAGRLLNSKPGTTSGLFEIDSSGVEEIPDEEPETTGMVTSIEGDTLTVQEFSANESFDVTGEGGVMIQEFEGVPADVDTESEEGAFFVSAGDAGPTVEVVITQETEIYKDETASQILTEDGQLDQVSEKIEMKIEPGSLDDIGENSFVTIWGERRGDRIIADVVLYEPLLSNITIQFSEP